MKKKLFIFFLTICMCFVLTGCGGDEEKPNEDNPNQDQKPTVTTNLENIQEKIEKLGIKCEKTVVYHGMVGAKDGFKLNSNDYRIEIYQFDKSSEAYKTAEASQKLVVSGMDPFSAVVKNGYAYIIDDEFPQHDAIVSILNELK